MPIDLACTFPSAYVASCLCVETFPMARREADVGLHTAGVEKILSTDDLPQVAALNLIARIRIGSIRS